MSPSDAILRRVTRELGGEAPLRALTHDLAPRDLESLLLHVAATRAPARGHSSLVAQFARGGATSPGIASPRLLHRFEHEAFEAARDFEMLPLPPVLPLGTATALARVHQNNVLTATRQLELSTDPTLALALISAERRRAFPSHDQSLRLGAHVRVMRLQPLEVKGLLPHFMLFALSSAGRTPARGAFAREALREHLEVHLSLLRRLSHAGFAFSEIGVEVTDGECVRLLLDRAGVDPALVREHVKSHRFGSGRRFVEERGIELPRGRYAEIQAALPPELARRLEPLDREVLAPLTDAFPEASFALDLSRLEGLGYYAGPSLRISATNAAGERFPLSDGGALDWTARLLDDRREAYFTSGLGPDLVCARFVQPESA
jgi:hypothetical protein